MSSENMKVPEGTGALPASTPSTQPQKTGQMSSGQIVTPQYTPSQPVSSAASKALTNSQSTDQLAKEKVLQKAQLASQCAKSFQQLKSSTLSKEERYDKIVTLLNTIEANPALKSAETNATFVPFYQKIYLPLLEMKKSMDQEIAPLQHCIRGPERYTQLSDNEALLKKAPDGSWLLRTVDEGDGFLTVPMPYIDTIKDGVVTSEKIDVEDNDFKGWLQLLNKYPLDKQLPPLSS